MNEQLLFIKRIKKRKRLISIIQLSILILFLFIWELLAKYNIINTFITSSPSLIIKTINNLVYKYNLFNHIFTTLKEVIISFILSFSFAFIIAFILYYYEILSKIFDPYLTILNSLPKVSLGPLIIIWLGSSNRSIIFMGILISIFISIIDIYQGFKSVNKNDYLLMKTFKASKFKTFYMLVVPSNISNIIKTIKINISMNFIGLLPPVGEKIFFNKCYSRY